MRKRFLRKWQIRYTGILCLLCLSLGVQAQTEVKLRFANRIGGTSTTFGDQVKEIKKDAQGNIYVIGDFFDNLKNVGGVDINLNNNTTNAFFAKYDAQGNMVWIKTINLTSTNPAQESVKSTSLDVDASGNLYITGGIKGTADFDPSGGVYSLTGTTQQVNSSSFIAKYDTNGGLIWAKVLAYNIYSQDIILDGNGHFYLAGFMAQTVDFDPGAGTLNKTSAGAFDSFIAKYDINCNIQWAIIDGNQNCQVGYAIFIANSGNILLAYTDAQNSLCSTAQNNTAYAEFTSTMGIK